MFGRDRPILSALVTLAILSIPAMYFMAKQANENRIVKDYLTSRDLVGLPVTRETAVLVGESIRADFNVNEASFTTIDMGNRPFLRQDSAFLLSNREGLCGEGTRAIVVLLNTLGFDATRITLYNKRLQSLHTLVSVKLDGKEFFVNSINSPDDISDLLAQRDISPADFDVLHYTGDIGARRDFDEREPTRREGALARAFFDKYWLYSFEAAPFTKLLTKVGIDVRLFNFMRPSPFISDLAEKPNLITALGLFFVAFSAFLTLQLLKATRVISGASLFGRRKRPVEVS